MDFSRLSRNASATGCGAETPTMVSGVGSGGSVVHAGNGDNLVTVGAANDGAQALRLVEALTPVTLQPAWEHWEAILTGQAYRFAFFDSLNRYYVADEHAAPDLAAAYAIVSTGQLADVLP